MLRIGHWGFSTKAAAERHIRAMFWRYPPMGALAGEDLEFALALIEMHPSRTIIVDCGIRSIHVQPVPFHEQDQRRFLVKRTDQSWRDFSWRNSLSPKSASRKLAGVLRYLIRDQVREFKEREFRGVCETCAIAVSPEACEVHHARPRVFEWLTEEWLKTVRLTPDDIAIVCRAEYEAHSCLEDPALAQSWIEYHEINAQLALLCIPCHKKAKQK